MCPCVVAKSKFMIHTRVERKRKEAEVEDEAIIKLPKLKGHINWTTCRDKFVSNISSMIGSRNISLLYLVYKSDCPLISRATPLIKVGIIDLLDDLFFASNTTHYGSLYTEDDTKVWMLIKKSLLGHQPYHYINEFEQRHDGRGAWLALKAYYEGDDFVNKIIQENLTKLWTLHYRNETQHFIVF